MSLKNYSIKSYGPNLMDLLFENLSIFCLTVQSVGIKTAFPLFRDVHKMFWAFRRMNQFQHYDYLVSYTKGILDEKDISNVKV